MFLVGLPGFMLALLVNFIALPPRGVNDSVTLVEHSSQGSTEVLDNYKKVLSNSHWTVCVAACVVMNFCMNSAGEWTPAFMVRVKHVSVEDVGIVVGSALAIGGLLGTLFAGRLTQRLARSHDSAAFLVPAIVLLPAAALFCGFVNLATTSTTCFAWLVMVMFFGYAPHGPALSVMMTSIPPHLRSQSLALYALLSRMFECLGPLVMGVISDKKDLTFAMQLLWVLPLVSSAVWLVGYLCLQPLPKTADEAGAGEPSLWSFFVDRDEVAVAKLAGGETQRSYGATA